jgi:predicted dehydrogenase
MEPIRWGILATGGIAATFTEDLARLPGTIIAAVASRTEGAAQAFAQRFAIPTAYGSWRELADDPDVDVVYVATPHSAHHAASKLCLQAGKAVLCEKPFTLDLASSTDLVETARAAKVFLMEAMWMRANPAIRRIVDLVAEGAIGEVTHVHADFGVAGQFEPGHRMRAPELGGGALLDLGVYPITFAHMFLGAPSAVAAWAAKFDEGTDRNTGIVLGYDGGGVATLHCGTLGEDGQRATITGTRGRIEVPRLFFRPEWFTLVRSGAEPEEIAVPVRGNGMGYEAEEVMACLRAGRTESELIPLDDTLSVMRTLDTVRAQIGVAYPAPTPR